MLNENPCRREFGRGVRERRVKQCELLHADARGYCVSEQF